jgi:hypothetical protein
MSESIETIKRLIDGCTDEERKALKLYLAKLLPHPIERDWEIDADTILSAIARSSDLTKRGVRGIIAEAVFVNEIIPTASQSGWRPVEFQGDHPYDALLQKGARTARIQVKLQRLEEGRPKLYYPTHYEQGTLFVVEVQKTRTGERTSKTTLPATNTPITAIKSITVKTRPYAFGDFDVLAVNMHPSTKDWRSFRYTVASWLLPRSADTALMEIFQPVAATPNDVWTDDLSTSLKWFEEGAQRRVLNDLIHQKRPKKA